MQTQAGERGSRLSPARVLLGSLIGGAGIAVLGFFWTASAASAAEPVPQPAPIGNSLLGTVASAVSGVDHAVADAVGPVEQAAATVAAPVVQPVAAPVAQAVVPVAAAVDGVIDSVPLTRELLGDSPVATVTAPVVDLLDDTVAAVVDPATDAVSESSLSATGPQISSSAAVLASATRMSARTTDGMSLALIIDGALGARPGVGSPGTAPGAPPTPGDGYPGDELAVMSGTASGAGPGAAGASVAFTERTLDFSAAVFGAHPRAADDDLPSSPVADHDISPD